MPLRLRNSEQLMSVAPPVISPKTPKTAGDGDESECTSDDYEFFNPSHPRQVLACFNELRKNGIFTDVILSADEKEFPCHRAILVAGKLNLLLFAIKHLLRRGEGSKFYFSRFLTLNVRKPPS